jgi:hypothetical protein
MQTAWLRSSKLLQALSLLRLLLAASMKKTEPVREGSRAMVPWPYAAAQFPVQNRSLATLLQPSQVLEYSATFRAASTNSTD